MEVVVVVVDVAAMRMIVITEVLMKTRVTILCTRTKLVGHWWKEDR